MCRLDHRAVKVATNPHEDYLPVPAHGAVDGGSFLGLAEEGIFWVAAPQLLAWVKCAVLQRGQTKTESCIAEGQRLELNSFHTATTRKLE